jgi:hypothetical protein
MSEPAQIKWGYAKKRSKQAGLESRNQTTIEGVMQAQTFLFPLE